MSETPKDTPSDDAVHLTKTTGAPATARARTGRTAASPETAGSAGPARPRSIDAVVYLLGVQIVMGFVYATVIRGLTSQITDFVWAKATKKDGSHYSRSSAADRAEIAKIVHNQQSGPVITAIVFGIAFALLAWSLRRYRSAGVARWALIVVMVFNGGPLAVVPISGYPGLLNGLRIVTGLVWLAVLVLLFVPDSRAYFKACRAATMPDGVPPTRPGLGSLFGGRFAPQPPSTPSTALPAAARPNAPRQKAKTRSDEAAIAKGAELARNRAKASKSRRSDV